MKQVQQLIELILIVARCFFRKKRSKAADPSGATRPRPPIHCDEADRSDPCPVRSDTDPDGQTAGQWPATGTGNEPGNPPEPGADAPDATRTGAVTLLGWCLIVTAATAWYYNHLY